MDEQKKYSNGQTVATVKRTHEYNTIPKHKGKRPNVPRKRLNIRLDETTYERLLDICIKKQCTITDYFTDIINRNWLGRLAILTGNFMSGPSAQTVAAPSRKKGGDQ